MWETLLIVQLTLAFNNGGAPITMPARTEGSYATIEECRDAFVRLTERSKKTVDKEPFLDGIKIEWACITKPVDGTDI